MNKQKLVTSQEAAALVGCSRDAILKRCKDGLIPGAEKVGRDWLIPERVLAKVKITPRRRRTREELEAERERHESESGE